MTTSDYYKQPGKAYELFVRQGMLMGDPFSALGLTDRTWESASKITTDGQPGREAALKLIEHFHKAGRLRLFAHACTETNRIYHIGGKHGAWVLNYFEHFNIEGILHRPEKEVAEVINRQHQQTQILEVTLERLILARETFDKQRGTTRKYFITGIGNWQRSDNPRELIYSEFRHYISKPDGLQKLDALCTKLETKAKYLAHSTLDAMQTTGKHPNNFLQKITSLLPTSWLKKIAERHEERVNEKRAKRAEMAETAKAELGKLASEQLEKNIYPQRPSPETRPEHDTPKQVEVPSLALNIAQQRFTNAFLELNAIFGRDSKNCIALSYKHETEADRTATTGNVSFLKNQSEFLILLTQSARDNGTYARIKKVLHTAERYEDAAHGKNGTKEVPKIYPEAEQLFIGTAIRALKACHKDATHLEKRTAINDAMEKTLANLEHRKEVGQQHLAEVMEMKKMAGNRLTK